MKRYRIAIKSRAITPRLQTAEVKPWRSGAVFKPGGGQRYRVNPRPSKAFKILPRGFSFMPHQPKESITYCWFGGNFTRWSVSLNGQQRIIGLSLIQPGQPCGLEALKKLTVSHGS